MKIPQIELRKRGVIPKETNVANQMGTQADRDREAANVRKDKRGGIRVSSLLLLIMFLKCYKISIFLKMFPLFRYLLD